MADGVTYEAVVAEIKASLGGGSSVSLRVADDSANRGRLIWLPLQSDDAKDYRLGDRVTVTVRVI